MIPVQQAMAFSDNVDIVNREALDRIAKTLAAEVRRLREENERQRFDILAMNQSMDLMREENERLRKDVDVDWLSNVIRSADGNHSLGAGALAEKIVEAIDAARGEK